MANGNVITTGRVISVLGIILFTIACFYLSYASDTLKTAVTEEELDDRLAVQEKLMKIDVVPRKEIKEMITVETAVMANDIEYIKKAQDKADKAFEEFKEEHRQGQQAIMDALKRN